MFQLMWNNIGVGQMGARFKCERAQFVRLRGCATCCSPVTLGLYRPFARVSDYESGTVTVCTSRAWNRWRAAWCARQQGRPGDALADAAGNWI